MFPLVVFLLISSICDAEVVKDPCTTPDLKKGFCIQLQECPLIFNMSNDFDTPLTIDRLNFLIESQCGYAGNNPKVCCPSEEIPNIESND